MLKDYTELDKIKMKIQAVEKMLKVLFALIYASGS